MSDTLEGTAMPAPDITVQVPDGWITLDPPPGVALIAIEPELVSDVRSNLVLTMVGRDLGEQEYCLHPTEAMVDAYLNGVLAELCEQLDDAEVIDVFVAPCGADGSPAVQRIFVDHRVTVENDDVTTVIEVSMVQQHVWLADTIVVVTATVPLDADERLIDTLNFCLESVALAPTE